MSSPPIKKSSNSTIEISEYLLLAELQYENPDWSRYPVAPVDSTKADGRLGLVSA
jgi:hypothetical protein